MKKKKNVKQESDLKIHILKLRYRCMMDWAKGHNYAIQDNLAEENQYRLAHKDLTKEKYCEVLEGILNEFETHLATAKSLGLDDFETFILDAIWGFAPHPFRKTEIKCAKEIAAAIEKISTDTEKAEYVGNVVDVVDKTTQKYNVYFNSRKWNISLGYFIEWSDNNYSSYNDYL